MKLIHAANVRALVAELRPGLRIRKDYLEELENYLEKEIRRSMHRVNGQKAVGKEHIT